MRKSARKSTKEEVFSRGEQTRVRIVSRALGIASVEGLAALTIGRLAKELRMSKSGLFAHFRSKEALELATVDRAREVFMNNVLYPAESGREGLETLWNLCHFWLEHVEQRVFPGGYFFTGAFFECAQQSGPVPGRITQAVEQWFDTLKRAVKQAQEQGEIDPEANANRSAFELNGLLVGAFWAHLMGDDDAFDEARAAVLRQLQKLATEEIPSEVFGSVRAFRKYLKERRA